MLFNNYLKRLIVPLSFVMVTIFSIHLSTQIFGDSENCGCFGDLIPMTPLQALIKNIITLVILIIYKKSTDVREKFHKLVILFLLISTLMFSLIPISYQSKSLKGSSSDEFLLYVENDEFSRGLGRKILCFLMGCEHCQNLEKFGFSF